MFRRFETLVDPFPAAPPERPPEGLMAFIWHYSRPIAPWIGLTAVLTACVSIMEVVFLGFLGSLVDLLAGAEREGFFTAHGPMLLGMALLVLIGFPLLTLVQSLLEHQTIFSNYPMLARWLAHRWMLSQSMSFFQDEFAGRVAQKVMQTALAIREVVTKLMEVMVYVAVYFIGALFLVGRADPWLMVPLVLWLVGYIFILIHYVPKLREVSMHQADARAEMTGRVVDSYTNIQTVKLFAHSRREQAYARESMDGFMVTVYRQMRLATKLTISLHTLNAALLAGIATVAVIAWHQALISLGRACRRDRRRHAHPRHVAVGALGGGLAVREHRHRAGRHQHADPRARGGRPSRRKGARGQERRDPLRPRPLPLRQGRRRDPGAGSHHPAG